MYLLGYDIGSSSVKASLVNAETGKCVSSLLHSSLKQRLLLWLPAPDGLSRIRKIGGKI